MERWLHQHIFKVGWLLTKNFQTTTILYYTFFLPGVFLYELIYWLVAGMLNVRAERSISWPQKQEIGELNLSFVRLARKTPQWKATIIGLAPLLAGIFFIWFMADSVFVVEDAFTEAEAVGGLRGLIAGVRTLTGRADFWLWAYVTFTVSNTMWPDAEILRRWWWIPVAIFGVSVPLLLIGVNDEVFNSALTGPIATIFNALTLILLFMIAFNLFAVAVLGSLESLIERITGDSATFKNGKMVVMRREERIRREKQERERARKARQRSKTPALQAGGLPSVYRLEFPIPGPPGKEPVTQSSGKLLEANKPKQKPLIPSRPKREEPDVIPGSSKPTDDKPEKPAETKSADAKESATADDKAKSTPDKSKPPVKPFGTSGGSPLRPAPKPSTDKEDDSDSVKKSPTPPPRSPFASSDKGADFQTRLEALRQRAGEEEDDDETDDDELTYEDVEDSV